MGSQYPGLYAKAKEDLKKMEEEKKKEMQETEEKMRRKDAETDRKIREVNKKAEQERKEQLETARRQREEAEGRQRKADAEMKKKMEQIQNNLALAEEEKKQQQEILMQEIKELKNKFEEDTRREEEAYAWAIEDNIDKKRAIVFQISFQHYRPTLDKVNLMTLQELNDTIRSYSIKVMEECRPNIYKMLVNYMCPPPDPRTFHDFDENAYNIIVIGPSGVGKSTFIQNTLCYADEPEMAEQVATAATECTIYPARYVVDDIVLWDIPGYGTDACPSGEGGLLYIQTFSLLWFDKVVILTASRVHEFESIMPRQLAENNIKCALGRTKVNVDVRAEKNQYVSSKKKGARRIREGKKKKEERQKEKKIVGEFNEEKFLKSMKDDIMSRGPCATKYFLIGQFEVEHEDEYEFVDAANFALDKGDKERFNDLYIFQKPEYWVQYCEMKRTGVKMDEIVGKMMEHGIEDQRLKECIEHLDAVWVVPDEATTGGPGFINEGKKKRVAAPHNISHGTVMGEPAESFEP